MKVARYRGNFLSSYLHTIIKLFIKLLATEHIAIICTEIFWSLNETWKSLASVYHNMEQYLFFPPFFYLHSVIKITVNERDYVDPGSSERRTSLPSKSQVHA